MVVWNILCIFAVMSDKDRELIKRLLNRDKTVGDEFLKLCSYAINYFIDHYYEDCTDKDSLRLELANDLYDYVISNGILLKFEGKKGCSLKTYLNSIAKFRLPRIELIDPLITKTNEKRKREEEKFEKEISSFDDEFLLSQSHKPTHIPTEFRDEDEAFDDDNFYVGIDEDDEEDVIVDIDDLKNVIIDKSTNSTIELVRETLKQMPTKEALLLQKQFYEGYDAKELAEELGYTINVIYNLKSKAMRDFRTIYTKLKNGLL